MHASTRAGRPYNTDATAAPSGGHPISIVVTDDISLVADLGNAGRPNRRRQPTNTDGPDQLSRAHTKQGLDSRGHTGNARAGSYDRILNVPVGNAQLGPDWAAKVPDYVPELLPIRATRRLVPYLVPCDVDAYSQNTNHFQNQEFCTVVGGFFGGILGGIAGFVAETDTYFEPNRVRGDEYAVAYFNVNWRKEGLCNRFLVFKHKTQNIQIG